jgi:hypothetical protein
MTDIEIRHWIEIAGIIFCILSILGIALGLMKKVTFYKDFNDLGISAATLAIPTMIIVAITPFLMIKEIFYLAGIVFLVLFGTMTYKTFVSNNCSILITSVLLVAKLAMSFLYVFYLYIALTGEKRADRGRGWFVLAILTPLLLALVKEPTGGFRLATTGRPSFG